VNIVFKNQMLLDLFEGRISEKKFKSAPLLVKKFQLAIMKLRMIETVSQIGQYRGFHYEKLKGNLNMYSSIRLDRKYRLIFREVSINQIYSIIDTIEVIEISNH
jgi:proteic killer suppression protein